MRNELMRSYTSFRKHDAPPKYYTLAAGTTLRNAPLGIEGGEYAGTVNATTQAKVVERRPVKGNGISFRVVLTNSEGNTQTGWVTKIPGVKGFV